MPKDVEKLKEKLKGLSVDEKNALIDALREDSPDSFLSLEEIGELREILKAKKDKPKKSFFDSLFE